MISYLYLPILTFCTFVLISIRRYWVCVDRLGYMKEVSKRAPTLLHRDLIAAVLAMVPFAMAAIDWFGITLPRQSAPIPSGFAALLSVCCVCACIGTLNNTLERLAGSWAGTRESALRTVAALRIIDQAELAAAMNISSNRNTKATNAQPIRSIGDEVKK
jgi:hypothetical protein